MKAIKSYLSNGSELLHDRVCSRVAAELRWQKQNGKRFISDEEVDRLIDSIMFDELCPPREDYDNRRIGEYRFTQDHSVKNKVLYIKGDQYDVYNWNYTTFVELLRNKIICPV